MNTRFAGDVGEKIAADYLEKEGYKILEHNAKYCDCEVDLICECYTDESGNLIGRNAKDKFVEKVHKLLKIQPLKRGERTIVFVEVKTRYGSEFGSAEEAVTAYKAGRYVTAAKSYLSQKRISGTNVRFDIIAIDDEGIRHIENAFCVNDAKYPRK